MQSLPSMNRGPGPHPHGMVQILRMRHNIHIRLGQLTGIELEFKSSQYHGQCHRGFQGGEFVAYAFACTSSEGEVGEIGGDLVRVQVGIYPFVWIVSRPFWYVGVGISNVTMRERCETRYIFGIMLKCKLYAMEQEDPNNANQGTHLVSHLSGMNSSGFGQNLSS